MQDEISAVEKARHADIVHFRAEIAALAASIRRCVQLGQAAAPRSKLLVELHGALTTECDGQERVDGLDERIRKIGNAICGLGPRNTRGEEGMRDVMGIFVQVSSLQAEKEGMQRELERVGRSRARIEKELAALGCHCHARMCEKCMELLRQCEECEEAGKAWEKMANK
jgi:hypothetical protein